MSKQYHGYTTFTKKYQDKHSDTRQFKDQRGIDMLDAFSSDQSHALGFKFKDV